ncbi:MAG: hypothetical protein M3303_00200, partial [Gemmatimonadota bacterium]|nr:hypothetical protein [Gemmatimonadota bacterium]
KLVGAGCPEPTVRKHLPWMVGAMLEHDIASDRRARAFLAQMLHECMRLRAMVEIWGPTVHQLRYGNILGNRGPEDGFRYRGRSPVMLTGRAHYVDYGRKLGVDLVNNPELAAAPVVGWRIAARYWRDKGLSPLADRGNFTEITRRINGAATPHDPSHHLARVALFQTLGAGCRPDPLTARERELVEELKKLRLRDAEPERRREIVRWLVAQRKRIYHEAQKTGWQRANRRYRYRILLKMTKP